MKRFKSQHLEAACWYLDCIHGFVIESEAELKSELDGGSVVIQDSRNGSHEAEGLEDQSSAPPPKRERRGRLRSLGSKSQASQDTRAESSAPGKETPYASPTTDVPKPSSTTAIAPSSISASEITRSLIQQRKAKHLPQTTSSAGTSLSTHVFVINSFVDSILQQNKKLSDKGGNPEWHKIEDFIRKVCSVP